RAMKVNGQTGALIEGIRGKTIDPEERELIEKRVPFDQQALDDYARNMEELPDKVTAKSLQKFVLFSALTCQWDCKWANMMVEEDGNARPIDGGAGIPTQDVVDNFAGRSGVMALQALTMYPRGTSRKYQPLPQAQ